ncbi:hypothetical protein FOQG_18803 [Fusarium oxysporum f. sp. raphani 54005]|uniref:Uncharacterized protein n=1 Tax=Fusarium oxysporum f. sp. raphani 54005 TaxID=1089458 RepID=X0BD84_FUSOX|nr:hypothetical protein FOQG_18803 [Fusarium oxysporum f. sp. raphani 54005]
MSDRSMGKVSAATRWGNCVASRLPLSRLQYKGAVEEPPSEYGKHPKKRFSTSRAHNQGIDSRKARKGEYRAGVLRSGCKPAAEEPVIIWLSSTNVKGKSIDHAAEDQVP